MGTVLRRSVQLAAVSLLFVALGCEGEAPTGEAQSGVESTTSELNMSGWYYDTGTQCTVGGVTMHCCPSGYAMIGIHVGNNVLKCARLSSGMSNNRNLDGGTQRNGMHACPRGQLMVGVHVGRNLFICETPVQSTQFEYVDTSTQDGYPMHVCASTSAMAGLHAGNNLLTCDY